MYSVDLCQLLSGGDNGVEAVVDEALGIAPLAVLPVLRLVGVVGHEEMKDGGYAVEGGGARFGLECCFGVAEVEVGVGIDDAGEDDTACGVDGLIGFGI